MGLFFKMNRAIKSEFNQMLRKTEDPEEVLDELIEDLEKQQKELKETLAKRASDKEIVEENLKEIEEKLECARHRKDFYVSRKKRMEAQKNILSAMSDIDDISRYDRIAKSDK